MVVWRTSAETFHIYYLVPTVKRGEGFVVAWGAIYWRGLGLLVFLRGKTTTEHYRIIHPILQTPFPAERSKMTTPLFTHSVVFRHNLIIIKMKWNISLSIFSPQISTLLILCVVFQKTKVVLGFLFHAHFLDWRPLCTSNGWEFHRTLCTVFVC